MIFRHVVEIPIEHAFQLLLLLLEAVVCTGDITASCVRRAESGRGCYYIFEVLEHGQTSYGSVKQLLKFPSHID